MVLAVVAPVPLTGPEQTIHRDLSASIETQVCGGVVLNEHWVETLGHRLDEIPLHYDFLAQLALLVILNSSSATSVVTTGRTRMWHGCNHAAHLFEPFFTTKSSKATHMSRSPAR
jgi:hypothetical protein